MCSADVGPDVWADASPRRWLLIGGKQRCGSRRRKEMRIPICHEFCWKHMITLRNTQGGRQSLTRIYKGHSSSLLLTGRIIAPGWVITEDGIVLRRDYILNQAEKCRISGRH